MSHHFDTKLAKEEPSLNVCDFYVFEGSPGTTVMVMTVNPDVGCARRPDKRSSGFPTTGKRVCRIVEARPNRIRSTQSNTGKQDS